MSQGKVYVMTDATGLVKIGKSKNPARRLRQMLTGNTSIRLAFTSNTVEDSFSSEFKCHDLLSDRRVIGEWFDCGIDVAITTVKMCTGNDYNEDTVKQEEIKVAASDAKGWQKTYAKSLAVMVDCGGGVAKVIAYILKNKNVDNMIIGTYQQIADKSGVSKRTVATAFKELSSKGFLRVKSPSCYMLDPNVMRYGSAGKGVALVTVWANI